MINQGRENLMDCVDRMVNEVYGAFVRIKEDTRLNGVREFNEIVKLTDYACGSDEVVSKLLQLELRKKYEEEKADSLRKSIKKYNKTTKYYEITAVINAIGVFLGTLGKHSGASTVVVVLGCLCSIIGLTNSTQKSSERQSELLAAEIMIEQYNSRIIDIYSMIKC